MAYTPYLWKNLPDETTPISAENLNHMEQGIADAHSLAADLETDKANEITSFTEASERANIASGETITVILGKIKKFFTDLKTVAFSGSYEDLSDQPTIPEIDDTTTSVSDLWSSSKTSDELADKMSYGDNGILGAKNLLPCNATSQVINGVTFTVNDDGTIIANGTATSRAILTIKDSHVLENMTYILSGCPSGGDFANGYSIVIENSSHVGVAIDIGEGQTFQGNPNITLITFISIRSGVTLDNAVFKPMIRLATDPDTTYQPYSMTNKQLTEEVREINTDLSLSVASTYSDALSFVNSDITVSDWNCFKSKGVVNVSFRITANADIPAWANLMTFKEGWRPASALGYRFSVSLNTRVYFNASSIGATNSVITSGTIADFNLIYPT